MPIEFKSPPAAEIVRLCRLTRHELVVNIDTRPIVHQLFRIGKEKSHGSC